MPNKVNVSGIPDTIRARITQIEEQLKQNANLSNELERLRRALAHLEGEARSRVNGRVRGRRPATPRKATPPKSARASKVATATKPATVRAARGENKAKILQALSDGPKTATEVAKQTGISAGTASATLTKLAKAGAIQKAARGYTLPK
jgi:predicted Rossmann fold nucleotide-binding protein DprA/Smf involved in DNA uptake